MNLKWTAPFTMHIPIVGNATYMTTIIPIISGIFFPNPFKPEMYYFIELVKYNT